MHFYVYIILYWNWLHRKSTICILMHIELKSMLKVNANERIA